MLLTYGETDDKIATMKYGMNVIIIYPNVDYVSLL